jgi:predicted transglutaminase-like cysteine proteinase
MTYTFENRGTTAMVLTKSDVAVPLFVNNDYQTIMVASANPSLGAPYTDEDGNMVADPSITLTIPPGGKITYTVTYNIESTAETVPNLTVSGSGGMSDIPSTLVNEYTSTTDTFWTNDTEITALAQSITADQPTVLGKVTSLVKWFNENVDYTNNEVPLYPNQTLKQHSGDCDDQSILLISMLRSIGVPSYLEIGVFFHSGLSGEDTVWDGHLAISEKGLAWHGWAMVYVPPWGWIPVDLTLTSNDDPLEKIKSAPEYTAPLVTAMKISSQGYSAVSVETRERIISSNIYVTSTETAEGVAANWIQPTMIFLVVGISAGVTFLFYTMRRRKQ